jgi:hypothetical protein
MTPQTTRNTMTVDKLLELIDGCYAAELDDVLCFPCVHDPGVIDEDNAVIEANVLLFQENEIVDIAINDNVITFKTKDEHGLEGEYTLKLLSLQEI